MSAAELAISAHPLIAASQRTFDVASALPSGVDSDTARDAFALILEAAGDAAAAVTGLRAAMAAGVRLADDGAAAAAAAAGPSAAVGGGGAAQPLLVGAECDAGRAAERAGDAADAVRDLRGNMAAGMRYGSTDAAQTALAAAPPAAAALLEVVGCVLRVRAGLVGAERDAGRDALIDLWERAGDAADAVTAQRAAMADGVRLADDGAAAVAAATGPSDAFGGGGVQPLLIDPDAE